MRPATAPSALRVQDALGDGFEVLEFEESTRTAADAALYAAVNDELDFARKLVELMDDPEKRAKMSESGRRRVEDVLAWPHQEARLLDVYRGLLPVPPAPESGGDGPS